MRQQYDRDAMVKADGDRTLAHLLDDILLPAQAVRGVYDRCGAKYEELVRLYALSRR
ncbi:hypothetical protein [Aminobacter sp. DSM 101952]|uniref:hypothetical protein n=1 Tax=Aminobacter sp. DSM 101952 TaxID=2735891 RepID=UPI0012E3E367|nr:hypothetical protein [Aminobacter sp. DSM 101952]